jgi:uncharacterized protein (UPF0332 family)
MSDSLSSFEWIQFLELAKELHNSASKDALLAEAKYRTVIGRAYYAAFNVAKQYLESQGISLPKNGKAHTKVRNHFDDYRQSNPKNENFSTVVDNLNNLRTRRNVADYKKKRRETSNWKDQSESAIYQADEVIESIAQLKKERKKEKPRLKK